MALLDYSINMTGAFFYVQQAGKCFEMLSATKYGMKWIQSLDKNLVNFRSDHF